MEQRGEGACPGSSLLFFRLLAFVFWRVQGQPLHPVIGNGNMAIGFLFAAQTYVEPLSAITTVFEKQLVERAMLPDETEIGTACIVVGQANIGRFAPHVLRIAHPF